MSTSLSAPASRGGYVPRRKRPSIWLLLPVMLLVVLSLLPLVYVGLKTWQAGWAEALHLLWRPYVFGLLRNTLALMIGVTVACGVIGLSLAWLLLPVLLLVVLSLLPLVYVGLKTWQAGWAEAL
ncbi:MAG: hypothetical protein U1A73_18980, partial [Pseudomonas sp.]|nr:hypothetical protein [Pseudomonas sp.]